jgi:thiol-disulfide isomerase/thioredoxin
MKSIVRKPAAFAAGFLITILISFAAPAQTPYDEAVKILGRNAPFYVDPLAPPSIYGPRPRTCFCDEDCFAALIEKIKKDRALPKRFPEVTFHLGPYRETRVTDFEGPQKFLQIKKEKKESAPFPVSFPQRFTSPLRTDGEIRVVDLDGLKKVLQRDPKDERPLLVNFWATWCDPCREEFPDLVKVDADYRSKGLNFVAVSLDDVSDVKSIVPKFLKEMKAEMPVVLLNVNDPEPAIKAVDATWDGQLPATFLYDKQGKVVFKHFGRIDAVELRNAIDKVVGGKP